MKYGDEIFRRFVVLPQRIYSKRKANVFWDIFIDDARFIDKQKFLLDSYNQSFNTYSLGLDLHINETEASSEFDLRISKILMFIERLSSDSKTTLSGLFIKVLNRDESETEPIEQALSGLQILDDYLQIKGLIYLYWIELDFQKNRKFGFPKLVSIYSILDRIESLGSINGISPELLIQLFSQSTDVFSNIDIFRIREAFRIEDIIGKVEIELPILVKLFLDNKLNDLSDDRTLIAKTMLPARFMEASFEVAAIKALDLTSINTYPVAKTNAVLFLIEAKPEIINVPSVVKTIEECNEYWVQLDENPKVKLLALLNLFICHFKGSNYNRCKSIFEILQESTKQNLIELEVSQGEFAKSEFTQFYQKFNQLLVDYFKNNHVANDGLKLLTKVISEWTELLPNKVDVHLFLVKQSVLICSFGHIDESILLMRSIKDGTYKDVAASISMMGLNLLGKKEEMVLISKVCTASSRYETTRLIRKYNSSQIDLQQANKTLAETLHIQYQIYLQYLGYFLLLNNLEIDVLKINEQISAVNYSDEVLLELARLAFSLDKEEESFKILRTVANESHYRNNSKILLSLIEDFIISRRFEQALELIPKLNDKEKESLLISRVQRLRINHLEESINFTDLQNDITQQDYDTYLSSILSMLIAENNPRVNEIFLLLLNDANIEYEKLIEESPRDKINIIVEFSILLIKKNKLENPLSVVEYIIKLASQLDLEDKDHMLFYAAREFAICNNNMEIPIEILNEFNDRERNLALERIILALNRNGNFELAEKFILEMRGNHYNNQATAIGWIMKDLIKAGLLDRALEMLSFHSNQVELEDLVNEKYGSLEYSQLKIVKKYQAKLILDWIIQTDKEFHLHPMTSDKFESCNRELKRMLNHRCNVLDVISKQLYEIGELQLAFDAANLENNAGGRAFLFLYQKTDKQIPVDELIKFTVNIGPSAEVLEKLATVVAEDYLSSKDYLSFEKLLYFLGNSYFKLLAISQILDFNKYDVSKSKKYKGQGLNLLELLDDTSQVNESKILKEFISRYYRYESMTARKQFLDALKYSPDISLEKKELTSRLNSCYLICKNICSKVSSDYFRRSALEELEDEHRSKDGIFTLPKQVQKDEIEDNVPIDEKILLLLNNENFEELMLLIKETPFQFDEYRINTTVIESARLKKHIIIEKLVNTHLNESHKIKSIKAIIPILVENNDLPLVMNLIGIITVSEEKDRAYQLLLSCLLIGNKFDQTELCLSQLGSEENKIRHMESALLLLHKEGEFDLIDDVIERYLEFSDYAYSNLAKESYHDESLFEKYFSSIEQEDLKDELLAKFSDYQSDFRDVFKTCTKIKSQIVRMKPLSKLFYNIDKVTDQELIRQVLFYYSQELQSLTKDLMEDYFTERIIGTYINYGCFDYILPVLNNLNYSEKHLIQLIHFMFDELKAKKQIKANYIRQLMLHLPTSSLNANKAIRTLVYALVFENNFDSADQILKAFPKIGVNIITVE